jgi:hypothetical protein
MFLKNNKLTTKKKPPKMRKLREKSECHAKKMSYHANFDKITKIQCPM